LDDQALADRFNLLVQEVPHRLRQLHEFMLEARGQRVRPGTDDKVLTAWNALALVAFSEAGRYLKRHDYTELAMRNSRFLLSELCPEGQLLRSWRAGNASQPAFLEDYAALILGLLALYQTDPRPDWFEPAVSLAEEMVAHFPDPAGGFFDTRDDQPTPVTRPKDIQDNATPSGNSLAVNALLQLSAFTGRGEWRDRAENLLASLQDAFSRYPTAFGKWLCALDFALNPTREVAILGDTGSPDMDRLVEALWASYRPHLVAAIAPYPPPPGSPELLADRPLLDGRPTAYVCRNFICHRPVSQPEELLALLEQGPEVTGA
jgi:uncharacterized protein